MKRACVIGSVHMDIFADINPDEAVQPHVDKRGSIHTAVGGTAFNVATHLRQMGFEIMFVTVLQRGSLTSRVILSTLEQMNMSKHVIYENGREAGFVAIRENGDMIFAVNSTPVENTEISREDLLMCMRNCDLVVVDMNNSTETIRNVLRVMEEERPVSPEHLYLLGTSEIKVKKIAVTGIKKAAGVFMNRAEMLSLLDVLQKGKSMLHMLPSVIDAVWVVTEGAEGVTFVTSEGVYKRFPDIRCTWRSYSGAGDAYAAGVIFAMEMHGKDVDTLNRMGLAVVERCAMSLASTPEGETFLSMADSIILRDPLTGLWNRRFYEEEKHLIESHARRTGNVFSVLMCDLDRFKQVNDTYGHAAGDEVLRVFGKIVRKSIRGQDIPVRYGGEEVMIILPGTGPEGARKVAEKIRKTVEMTPVRTRGEVIRITVSIGVSSGCDSVDEVAEEADAALYEAKSGGRNRIVMTHSLKV